jgi:hypothetical protein
MLCPRLCVLSPRWRWRGRTAYLCFEAWRPPPFVFSAAAHLEGLSVYYWQTFSPYFIPGFSVFLVARGRASRWLPLAILLAAVPLQPFVGWGSRWMIVGALGLMVLAPPSMRWVQAPDDRLLLGPGTISHSLSHEPLTGFVSNQALQRGVAVTWAPLVVAGEVMLSVCLAALFWALIERPAVAWSRCISITRRPLRYA